MFRAKNDTLEIKITQQTEFHSLIPFRVICPPEHVSRGLGCFCVIRMWTIDRHRPFSFTHIHHLMTMPPSRFHPPPYSYAHRSTASIISISLLFLVTVGVGIEGFFVSVPTIPLATSANECHWSTTSSTALFVGSSSIVTRYVDDDGSDTADTAPERDASSQPTTPTNDIRSAIRSLMTWNGPPIKIDDTNLLLYDTILLTNLSVSISFFVVHRLNYYFVPSSLNEGAVLSLCWIIAGLANGSFLYSAVDGHYDPRDEDYASKGGPKAAGLLAVSTFVSASSLRIVFALLFAMLDHRPVGSGGEELIPLEIPFGLFLMSAWRTLHAEQTTR
jgi:hypothetical protein